MGTTQIEQATKLDDIITQHQGDIARAAVILELIALYRAATAANELTPWLEGHILSKLGITPGRGL